MVRADGRLSREGRLLRTVVGVAVLIGAFVVGPRAFASGSDGADAPRPYVVSEGDTLWAIAGAMDSGEPRDVAVAAIMRLNGMKSPALRAGEQILIPGAS